MGLFVQPLSLFVLSSERIISILLLVRTLLHSFQDLLVVLSLLLYESELEALDVLVVLFLHSLYVRLRRELLLNEVKLAFMYLRLHLDLVLMELTQAFLCYRMLVQKLLLTFLPCQNLLLKLALALLHC